MHSIFLDTLHGKKCERPPVWFMRQAGRIIPAYRQLREKYSFHELMNIPELTAEVTLQPVHELGVDAAILFSDILVIPEAMGMKLEFTDKGPRFENPLKDCLNPLATLHPDTKSLQHIYDAIDIVIKKRPENTPLIGFCGAPLTTLVYMVQGISSNHQFPDAVKFIYENKDKTKKILSLITDLSIEYAREQVRHGINAFQLFDTHAGLLPNSLYKELILPHVMCIISALQAMGTPVIFFPKGLGCGINMLKNQSIDFVGVDWLTRLEDAREILGKNVGLQGNLDPRILTADQETITKALSEYFPFGRKTNNWIFNLGHGVLPETPFENAKFVVDWVKGTGWGR